MLTVFDNVVLIIYLVFVIGIGFFFVNKIKGMEDFYLAGKRLPLSLAVGTLMASWYGSTGTIATAEYAFVYGISCWVVWCIPAHFSRIPMALWIGPKVRMTDGLTVPDLLEKLYDRRVAIAGAVLILFYCTQIFEITALKIIGESTWNFNPFLFAAIMVFVVALYTFLGGLFTVAITDMIQMFFMVLGLTIALPFAWADTGGWSNIVSGLTNLKEAHILEPLGGMSWLKMATMVLLGLGAYADPAFYQRFSAANSPSTARRSLLICLLLWISFDAVLTIMGLLAKVTYPEMVPGNAYITISLQYLPAGLKGLFIAGILGAIMSTLDSYFLIGGVTLASDLYAKNFNPQATQKQIINLTRVGIIFMAVVGLLLSSKFQLVADAWVFVSGSWTAAGFVPIVAGLFWPYKRTAMGGLLSLVIGGGTVILWTLAGSPFGIDGLLIGMPLSFIAFLIGNNIGPNVNVSKGGVVNV